MSSTEWVELPSNLGDYPDKIKLHNGELLLRYSSDGMTMRIEGVESSEYEDLKKHLRKSNHAKMMIKLLSLIDDSDNVTQVGSKVTVDEDVPDRFNWNCPSCTEETFQIRGQYTGLHAVCINCGQRASVIINECRDCGRKSIFVKESANTESWYKCYSCSRELD